MAIRLGFVTGARSDYGLTRKLLSELSNDSDFEVYIYVTGLHLLNKYGYTINEIMGDGYNIKKAISTYTEDGRNRVYEFITTVDKVYRALRNENLDAVYIVGDRIEAYASALAAHFLGIPIVHYAGGQITKGAVDNIYRYNISNLASIHLTTCKSAFERLRNNYPIESENVYLVGSTAVDAIFEYKKNPQPISDVFPVLRQGNFALMTFQPVTKSEEPIAALMDSSIKKILQYKVKVLLTYPNNDTGSEEIIKIIQRYQKNDNVIVSQGDDPVLIDWERSILYLVEAPTRMELADIHLRANSKILQYTEEDLISDGREKIFPKLEKVYTKKFKQQFKKPMEPNIHEIIQQKAFERFGIR